MWCKIKQGTTTSSAGSHPRSRPIWIIHLEVSYLYFYFIFPRVCTELRANVSPRRRLFQHETQLLCNIYRHGQQGNLSALSMWGYKQNVKFQGPQLDIHKHQGQQQRNYRRVAANFSAKAPASSFDIPQSSTSMRNPSPPTLSCV